MVLKNLCYQRKSICKKKVITKKFTFKIRKVSEGRNKNKATENAAKIDYHYSNKKQYSRI